jgi:hypothetical protein
MLTGLEKLLENRGAVAAWRESFSFDSSLTVDF